MFSSSILLHIIIIILSHVNILAWVVVFLFLQVKKMKIIKDVIALRFKTSESEGIILHGEGQQGDYITLELHKAKLQLQINLGEQHTFTHKAKENIFSC